MNTTCENNDLAASARTFMVFWGLPLIAAGVGGVFQHPTSTLVWTGALFWAGGACALNATRCRRLHCYITGPLFLLAGVAILLAGFGIVSLPSEWILIAVVAGTILAYAAESAFDIKYVTKVGEN